MRQRLFGAMITLLVAFYCLSVAHRAFAEPGVTQLLSKDKKIELKLSPNWAAWDPDNEDAEFGAKDDVSSSYLLLISEPKEDFRDLKSYADIVSKRMASKFDNPKLEGPESIQLAGNSAMRFELNGFTKSGLNINYVLTLVETPSRYNQVLTWTMHSRYPANKSMLLQVASGLKENSTP